jgi:deoxyhypusine synthase
LDIQKINDFDDMLQALGKTAFGARNLGEAAEVLAAMVQDPEVTVVGTFSGAMSVAKMGLMLCDMLDRGWLDIVITTGALVAHGFIENLGRAHYKYPQERSDRELYLQGYNRIYDTLEMEANLDYAEDVVREVLESLDHQKIWASESLCRELGRHLAEHTDQPGLLRNAYLKGAPVYIPAFTDSELGLDLAGYMVRRALAAGEQLPQALSSLYVKFNPFLDLGSYAQTGAAGQKIGDFHRGGRGAEELGPTGGPLSGTAARPIGA